MKIDTQSFIKVSQILERDSKDASYKFALMRATIDVISLFDQHIISSENKVIIPTGLIIERWLWYYYPLIDSEIFLPQKNSEPEILTRGRNIAFRKHFNLLIEEYSKVGNYKQFYNDYKKKNLSSEVNILLLNLVLKLYETITNQPMKFIGKSISKSEYSIYKRESGRNGIVNNQKVTTELLIKKFGTFSIPSDYYLVLKYLGSFIGGENAILNKWADFVVAANRNFAIDKSYILSQLSIKPESFRDVSAVDQFFKNKQNLRCVWSGKKITGGHLNIDHILPFAHYLNNDVWNLLPTLDTVNNKKRDKIPTPDFIENRKNIIIDYWFELKNHFQKGFEEEIRISLSPNINFNSDRNWEISALNSLKNKAEFLINIRGLDEWSLL
jgi:hypothetical protein